MKILDVRIDEVTMDEAVDKVKTFLTEDRVHLICTPNPEMLMTAQDDAEFKNILNSSELNIPDGTGIVWASKKLNGNINERVAGFDFIHRIFELGKEREISFYFLGSKPKVAENAGKKIEKIYSGTKIVGSRDGYFSLEEEKKVVKEINAKNPDVLLVAMGAPKQERFINKYKEKLNCKVAIGVGGCFDVIAGNVKRAPKIFIKLRLEWLYRGLTDFKRLKRLGAIPRFMIAIKGESKRK